MPHLLIDQALESIPQTNPGSEVLLARREAGIGKVVYGLVAYRPAFTSDSVQIMGVAVDDMALRAWEFVATCQTRGWIEGLVATLEKLSTLN